MGESIVDVSRDEDKMAETAASKPDLEVSVSFGRFANDSLSWEKWSAFSPNKYLEEVEKCATPGSVAQKKAYFEARYKKIAARRAELMDQGNQMEDDPLWSKIENSNDLTGDVRGAGLEFDILNSHSSTQEVVKQETKLIGEAISTNVADLKEDAAISIENQKSFAEMAQEMDSLTDSPESCKPEKAIVVEEGEEEDETALIESKDMDENSNNWDNEIGKGQQVKEEKVKLDNPKESKKVSPVNKERNVTRVKKKSALPATKASHISSPKVSKPSPAYTSLSASRSSKKGHHSSLPRNKTPSVVGSKKVAPKSLHMSIGLEPTNFEPSSHSTTRKSFIMEEMGDKDIVKRAFKTFQKNVNQLKPSVEERSLVAKQVPTKGTEPRVSSSMTSRKENAGSVRAGGTDRKSAKVAPSSFGLKNDEKTRKRNEKLEEKSTVKEATRTGLQSKSKEEKGVEIRKLRQSLTFKATPLPAFYGALKMSKSALDKYPVLGDVFYQPQAAYPSLFLFEFVTAVRYLMDM
ncbi:Protein WAVE-DAMPENED 2 [Morella rubra]|uniref:Protein WAVE-DAMPENED 2 n=1 Tax=Morella rubra TaxID=262757 RepID=A0A6A1V7M9_9ROSI|nr:Protein WAVE-DAMPENED 2 [Morella rubra]